MIGAVLLLTRDMMRSMLRHTVRLIFDIYFHGFSSIKSCYLARFFRQVIAEEHRRLREATAAAATVGQQQGRGASMPWGKGPGAGGNGGSKPAMSLLEIQQQEARMQGQQEVKDAGGEGE